MRLGSLELGTIPRVAACFTDEAGDQQIASARRAGVDIAELRIDQFSSRDADHVRSVLARFSGFPTIGTIRVKAEGGEWGGDERERLSLYRSIVPWVDAIDIELRSSEILGQIAPEAKATDRRLIVSHHDFSTTPDQGALDRIRKDAIAAGADIVKICTQVTNSRQIRDLSAFCVNHLGIRGKLRHRSTPGREDWWMLETPQHIRCRPIDDRVPPKTL